MKKQTTKSTVVGQEELPGGRVADIRQVIGKEGVSVQRKVQDILDKLFDSQSITLEMFTAGKNFQSLFVMANIDTLKAQNLDIGGGGLSGGEDEHLLRVARAKQAVFDMIMSVGGLSSPMGSILYHVIGLGDSVNKWVNSYEWGGNKLNNHNAKGLLIGALSVVAVE
jgi:hypothetical protein